MSCFDLSPSLHTVLEAALASMHQRQYPASFGRIFHSEGLCIGGRFFAFIKKDRLVLKLPAKRVELLVASGKGEPFDAGPRRPMKEWVILQAADQRTLIDLLAEAAAFVESTLVSSTRS